jgi:mRNA-degrading endonuclease toxin of MazEF toxin-antitoxin module
MALDRGDIVLVEHAPFSNHLETKARPALILSANDFNRSQPDVVCAAISSRIRPDDPYRVDILEDSPAFGATRLRRSSCVKCAAIFAYRASLIRRRLGRAPQSVMDEVAIVTRRILGLGRAAPAGSQ